jgi:hypothetical protein
VIAGGWLLYFKNIPEMFLSSQQYDNQLLQEWRNLKNRSALWAQREYMEIVRRWWYYGCCCFGVQLTSAPTHDTKLSYLFANGLAKLPLAVTIGVCEDGVLILEADHDAGSKAKGKAHKDKATWTIGSKQVLARFDLADLDLPRCKDRTHEFQLSLKMAADGAYVFKTIPGRSYDVLQMLHSYDREARRKQAAEEAAEEEVADIIAQGGGNLGIMGDGVHGENKGARGSKTSTIANAMGGARGSKTSMKTASARMSKKQARPTAPPPAPPQRTSSASDRMGYPDKREEGPPPLPVLSESANDGDGGHDRPAVPPMPAPKPSSMVAAAGATGTPPPLPVVPTEGGHPPLPVPPVPTESAPPPLPVAPTDGVHPPLPLPPGGGGGRNTIHTTDVGANSNMDRSNMDRAFGAAPRSSAPHAAMPHRRQFPMGAEKQLSSRTSAFPAGGLVPPPPVSSATTPGGSLMPPPPVSALTGGHVLKPPGPGGR